MIQSNKNYVFCPDLMIIGDVEGVQKLQTTSVLHHQQLNVMLLTLPAGHTLNEHNSPRLLTLQVMSGEGTLTIEDQSYEVQQGAWFFVAPNVPHEIVSQETLVMVLSLFGITENTTGASKDE